MLETTYNFPFFLASMKSKQTLVCSNKTAEKESQTTLQCEKIKSFSY